MDDIQDTLTRMNRRGFLTGGLTVGAAGMTQAGRAADQSLAHSPIALSADQFELNGVVYRLADVVGPQRFQLNDRKTQRLSESRAILQEKLVAQSWEIRNAGLADRWGRKTVLLMDERDGREIALSLVEAGAVRVSPQTDDAERISELLILEAAARKARLGLWAHAGYQIYPAENAWSAIGGYHLIEGAVYGTAFVRSNYYINFDEDYRRDFTAIAKASVMRGWVGAGKLSNDIKQTTLLRIRGFVERFNGPAVRLVHPQQVEFL